MKPVLAADAIAQRIYVVRGQRVMLDADLAALYGVPTGRLNEQVKRNRGRFPTDFAFQLTQEEVVALRSQFAISNRHPVGRGGRTYLPFVFTEQGVAMLSSVLKSERAVQVNIEIMRAFIRLKQWALSVADLTTRLDALEAKYDRQFKIVFDAIRGLMTPTEPPRKRIGFRART